MLAFVLGPCFEFLFDVPIETRVKVFYSASGNMCFVCVSDCFVSVVLPCRCYCCTAMSMLLVECL